MKKTKITRSITGTLHKLVYGKFDDLYEVPKIIVIDEFSMVDNCVFLNILRYCIAFQCKLIILADQHQLPPIGGGFPLDNLLQSNEISKTFLTKIKRQDNGNLKNAILNISNNVLLKNLDFDKKSLHFYNYSKSNLENLIRKFNLHPNNCQFISYYSRYNCNLEPNNLTAMNRIKEVLADKGIKQTWLAEKLGKSYNMVNSYVQNRQQPRLEVLNDIAEILDVDVRELIISNKETGE